MFILIAISICKATSSISQLAVLAAISLSNNNCFHIHCLTCSWQVWYRMVVYIPLVIYGVKSGRGAETDGPEYGGLGNKGLSRSFIFRSCFSVHLGYKFRSLHTQVNVDFKGTLRRTIAYIYFGPS